MELGLDANAGGYVGSSGGISSYYSIPSWQTNVSNLAGRGGSTSQRNIPDVALTADNVYVKDSNGSNDDGIGGTSCAAPLWAGFMALVNQQAAANGRPSAGFINPAIYAIAAGSSYAACFHDVTTGNNTWSSSPNLFYATNGYDLCTGLGTPAGQNLINALAGAAQLTVSPKRQWRRQWGCRRAIQLHVWKFSAGMPPALSLAWSLAGHFQRSLKFRNQWQSSDRGANQSLHAVSLPLPAIWPSGLTRQI